MGTLPQIPNGNLFSFNGEYKHNAPLTDKQGFWVQWDQIFWVGLGLQPNIRLEPSINTDYSARRTPLYKAISSSVQLRVSGFCSAWLLQVETVGLPSPCWGRRNPCYHGSVPHCRPAGQRGELHPQTGMSHTTSLMQ